MMILILFKFHENRKRSAGQITQKVFVQIDRWTNMCWSHFLRLWSVFDRFIDKSLHVGLGIKSLPIFQEYVFHHVMKNCRTPVQTQVESSPWSRCLRSQYWLLPRKVYQCYIQGTLKNQRVYSKRAKDNHAQTPLYPTTFLYRSSLGQRWIPPGMRCWEWLI